MEYSSIISAIRPFVAPIFTVLCSFVLAFFIDKIVLKKLQKIAALTDWEGDDIFIAAIKNISKYIIIALGIYLATLEMSLPESIETKITKSMIVVIVLLATIVIARIAVGFVKLLPGKSEGAFPGSSIFINVTRITIFILGFVFILQQLGISITPIITALGVGGLAVALALQDTLANLFAGLNVIAARRLHQGDFIQLENGQEGIIEDITWRNTLLRDQTNNNIIIPNTKVASSIIKNYSTPLLEVFVIIKINVDYETDLEHVERVLIAVGTKVMEEQVEAVKDHVPFVQFKEFDESSIVCEVYLKSQTIVDRGAIRHIFIKKIQQEFKIQGINIPYPTRRLVTEKETLL